MCACVCVRVYVRVRVRVRACVCVCVCLERFLLEHSLLGVSMVKLALHSLHNGRGAQKPDPQLVGVQSVRENLRKCSTTHHITLHKAL